VTVTSKTSAAHPSAELRPGVDLGERADPGELGGGAGTPPADPMSGTLLSRDTGGVTFALGLPVIQPGDAQVFRLYLGAATTLGDVAAGLTNHGASVLSQAAGGLTRLFSAAPRGRRR